MCRRVTCRKCGKPSFAGCGQHIESVLGDVPVANRCAGHAKDSAAPRAEGEGSPSLWKRLCELFNGPKEGSRS